MTARPPTTAATPAGDTSAVDGAVARLLVILVREIEAVSNLAYRQHVCLLLLGAASINTLDTAVDDLVDAEDELASLEVLRSAASADLAVRLGIDPASHRLRDLTEALGDDGAELSQRADELRSLTAELQESRALATDLATAQLDVVAERAGAVNDTLDVATYGPDGSKAPEPR